MHRIAAFVDDSKQFPSHYGKWTHLAVKRFLADLEDEDGPYVFAQEKAGHAIDFIERLYQTKGRWGRKRLVLEPWQVFLVGNLFGWIAKDTGLRRFNVAYISIGRKNGKSTLISAISLYLLVADKEPSAEIYCGANSREQASLVFDQIKGTIEFTPGLSKRLNSQTASIIHRKSLSFIKKVSSESRTLDGLNVHGAILDEIHEFKNDHLWNVFRGGMGSREQPMLIGITTAGLDKTMFGYQQETYTKEVLSGTLEDPTYFGLIFSIDEEDDPSDESVWVKGNPNLNVSVSLKDMQSQFREAKFSPQKMNDFIAKRLNRYTSTTGGWLATEAIERCLVEKDYSEEELRGLDCFVGYDGSFKHDFTTYSLTFPSLNYYTIWRFFLPSENFKHRVEFENANYQTWVDQKFLTLTPGESIDYEFVVHQVEQDKARYNFKGFFCDPNRMQQIKPMLKDIGIEPIDFGQGMRDMAPAASQLTYAIMHQEVSFSRNPIAMWCLSNVEIKPDVNDNYKFLKKSDKKRIDGTIALTMSHFRAWLEINTKQEEEPKPFLFFTMK